MRPPVVALPSRAGLRALLAALSAAVGSTLWRRPSQALGIAAPAHVMLLLLLAALSPRRGSGGGRVRPGRDLLLPFLAGLIAAALHQTLDPAPALLRAWVGAGYDPFSTPVALRVRLLDRQDLADERQAFTVELLQARPAGPLRPEETPVAGVRARLTLGRTPSLQPAAFRVGDLLDLTARLGPPRRFRNPGSFDYATYLEARGIALVGTIKSPFLVRRVRRPVFSWRRLLSEGREAIVASLDRSTAGKDPATASFLAALLVGEREELSPPLEQALIRSGVYHVVALSGLNVAVVALLCGMLLRPLPIAAPLRRLALLLAILLYAGLARDSGSMVRAALMATLYLTGALAGRRVSVLGAAGVAGWLIVLWRPAYLEDAGFQLSMAATLGLMLYGPPAAPPRPGRRPVSLFFIVDHLRRSVRLSGAALAATTLLTGLHFQRLAPVALLANLIAVPIANLLLVLALAIALCFPFIPVAGSALAGAAAPLITLLASVVTSLSAWPGASFQVLPPPPALVIFTGDILILGGLVTRRRIRSAALAIVILSSACVALRGRGGLPQGSLEVTALDVGQGDAILVRLPMGGTILVDAGGLGRGGFDVGEKVVAPALRALGILHLDLLLITHAHHDHLGGAAAVLEQFRPAALWLGRMPGDNPEVTHLIGLADALRIPVLLPRRGVRIPVGGVRLEVLNPGPGPPDSGPARNDDSLVLRLLYGRLGVLLTGDLEAPLESVLVRDGWPLQADLLKVGHHGSRTSSSGPFLERIRPVETLISAGAGNPWGHPDPETLDRLSRLPAGIHRTDRDGAVRCRTDGLNPWSCVPIGSVPPPDLSGASRGGSERE